MNLEAVEQLTVSEKIKYPLKEFEDLRGKDLSEMSFLDVNTDLLFKTTFDTKTIWPEKDSLPDDFDPEKVLENGLEPGLGIKSLHRRGIDGRGVKVAIIDQKLDLNHPEYSNQIDNYAEHGREIKNQSLSKHGPSVASFLVGERVGTAPGAKMDYHAVETSTNSRHFDLYTEALNNIIENNKKAEKNEKVRVVSCSIGYVEGSDEEDLEEWKKAIREAKENDIILIDPMGGNMDMYITGCGSKTNKDDVDTYETWLGTEKGISEIFRTEKDVQKILEKLRTNYTDKIAGFSDEQMTGVIEDKLKTMDEEIAVPSDYRTMASSWNGKNEYEYEYEGKGGLSWAVPYLSGVFALALQVNPNIKVEEIAKIIKETFSINKKGLKIINPVAIVETIEKQLKDIERK